MSFPYFTSFDEYRFYHNDEEVSQCFESRNQEEKKVNEQSKKTEGHIPATSKRDKVILPDKEANGVLEKVLLTRRERAFHGVPSRSDVKNHGYSYLQNITNTRFLSLDGEASETTRKCDYINTGIVGIHVEHVEMKDGSIQAARCTLVSPRMKILRRQKIKPDGSVCDYRSAETGLSATALAEVTMTQPKLTKILCETFNNNTIIVSFAPEMDLHLMKITHERIVLISTLYNKDLQNGLPIDRMSLVERYLPEEYKDVDPACQAIGLLVRWYAVHNYSHNVREGVYDWLPLFPHIKPPTTDINATSKQSLIWSEHAKLSWRYRHILIREPNPVLHGTKVIRVHVKKWPQVKGIERRLLGLSPYIREKLHLSGAEHEAFRMISFPISMKSKTSAKGFFVYLYFENELSAELSIKYFTTEFEMEGTMVKYKCELSLPRKAKGMDHKGVSKSKTYNIIAHSMTS